MSQCCYRCCCCGIVIIWFRSMPQKLSNRTLSLPMIHRMRILMLFFSSSSSSSSWVGVGLSLILKPSWGVFASSSSSSSSCSSLFSSSLSSPCLCLVSEVPFRSPCRSRRRADRDHTFSFANPIPVANEGRYCHCILKELKMAFRRDEVISRDGSGRVKPYSTGNGRRCFGRPGIPRTTDLGSC